jgi:prepilin-type N-terminal cleavage/methylation domain-containing protein
MRTAMRKGFTLIETVVTVGIVAAMAAVVIPQVAKQFDAADPTRTQNDLKNIQTAIETFNVNVSQLPGDLDDLVNTPGVVANDDSTLTTATTAAIFTSQASVWKGPYIDMALVDALNTDQTITTGYGATILDTFVCYDTGNNEAGVSQGSSATPTAQFQTCPNATVGAKFLAVQITGIPCTDTAGSTFMTINALFDGASEGGNSETLGRIRCRLSGATNRTTNKDVTYFLAVSLQ